MKKLRFLSFALGSLLLAGCSMNEFEGATENVLQTGNGEISFSMNTPNITRAAATTTGEQAAEKLNKNFVVYGFKNVANAEDATASNDELVFDLYNVNYEKGTSNTTKSNTSDWEYVGYTSLKSKSQTIKYWDFSAKQYVFSAVSGIGITPEKVTSGTTVYDKG